MKKTILVAAVLWCIALPQAKADTLDPPLFTAIAGIDPGCQGGPQFGPCSPISSSTSASIEVGPLTDQGGAFLRTQEAFASAAPGVLRARATEDVSLLGTSSSPMTPGAGATATLFLDDVIVTGPSGGSAQISFNLALNGSLGAIASDPMIAGASARVLYSIENARTGASTSDALDISTSNPNFISESSGAIVSGPTGVIQSGTFTVMPGDTLFLSLILGVGASAGCGSFGCPSGLTASAFSNFSDTVGFPSIGPVANLPSGWTINSASGLVADNRFTGAIPEPTSLLLLGSGLGGMGLLGRKRLRCSQRQ